MTFLKVTDKVGLGQLIIEAAANDDLRRRLLEDANEVLKELVEIPAGHRIEVVPQEPGVTRMMLPLPEDLSLGDEEAKTFSYPQEYDSASSVFIDPKEDPLKAFQFGIGDYVLKNCR